MLALYAREPGRRVRAGGLVRLLGEFGFSVGASRVALSRLVQRGLLERVKDGREVSYGVTAHCEHVLAEGDRRVFSFGTETPAGRWTIVCHSVPAEQARASLAQRLRFLGFGLVSDGTWLSPHDRARDVELLTEDLEVASQVEVLLGAPVSVGDARSLITRIWDIDGLRERYRDFVVRFAATNGVRDDRDAFVTRTSIAHEFRHFPLLDPEPPSDVLDLPERDEAVAVFRRALDSLRAASERYFAAAAGPSIQRADRVK